MSMSNPPNFERARAYYKGTIVRLVEGNILNESHTAIVSTANENLEPGPGSDNVIRRAAGPELGKELKRLNPNGGRPGRAYHTRAHNIKHARWIIYAIGPNLKEPIQDPSAAAPKMRDPNEQDHKILRRAYWRSLELLVELEKTGTSIAFITTSHGAFHGYSSETSARIAMRTVKAWLKHNPGKVGTISFFIPHGAQQELHAYTNLPDIFTEEEGPETTSLSIPSLPGGWKKYTSLVDRLSDNTKDKDHISSKTKADAEQLPIISPEIVNKWLSEDKDLARQFSHIQQLPDAQFPLKDQVIQQFVLEMEEGNKHIVEVVAGGEQPDVIIQQVKQQVLQHLREEAKRYLRFADLREAHQQEARELLLEIIHEMRQRHADKDSPQRFINNAIGIFHKLQYTHDKQYQWIGIPRELWLPFYELYIIQPFERRLQKAMDLLNTIHPGPKPPHRPGTSIQAAPGPGPPGPPGGAPPGPPEDPDSPKAHVGDPDEDEDDENTYLLDFYDPLSRMWMGRDNYYRMLEAGLDPETWTPDTVIPDPEDDPDIAPLPEDANLQDEDWKHQVLENIPDLKRKADEQLAGQREKRTRQEGRREDRIAGRTDRISRALRRRLREYTTGPQTDCTWTDSHGVACGVNGNFSKYTDQTRCFMHQDAQMQPSEFLQWTDRAVEGMPTKQCAALETDTSRCQTWGNFDAYPDNTRCNRHQVVSWDGSYQQMVK